MDRLILFDIDGTLTRTQNGYVPFNEALLKTFGIPGDIRTVVPDGNTDPLIVEEIFAKSELRVEISSEQWQKFTDTLHDSYANAVRNGSTQVRQLPGTAELLEMLAQVQGLSQSIVTGNMEVIANVKLGAAGLSSYLCRGAYGSDSRHRADLPKIAKVRCEAAAGRAIRRDHCVIVGDTPKDLEAARKNSMKCVLVGTGRYPMEELVYFQPDAYLPDLTDTAEIVKTLLNIS